MVLLISTEFDMSTDEVIDWLNYFGVEYIRINGEDKIENFVVKINKQETNFELHIKNKIINSNSVKSFWYRKHGIGLQAADSNYLYKTKIIKKFLKFVNYERSKVEPFIEYVLSKKHNIGYLEDKYVNKLKILQTAKDCGLLIPETIITTSKSLIKHKNFIIKAISEGMFYVKSRKRYMMYTKKVNFDLLSDNFNLTLFQSMIEKEFELRIFFLKGEYYSMAIFSQNDKKTQIDFRKYNNEKPNRTVPYNIPDSLNRKIINLMNKLKLNTGSLDFIVDKTGNYYFLEINPSGQFGMVSKPCNYFLEKEIAQELIKYEE